MFSKKYKNLDELLLFIEENIDLEHQKEVEKLHLKVNKFEPVPYYQKVVIFFIMTKPVIYTLIRRLLMIQKR